MPALEDLERALGGIEKATALPALVYKAEPFRALIEALPQAGVECRAIFGRLQAEGYTGSYSALYRFVRRLEPLTTPVGFCRIETLPGEEAQVDFGYAGPMRDRTTGEVKRAWFFVMTLSFSRHQFVRFVFDQSVDTWLRCHRLAFEWFGGVPIRIKIDNLKAAIVRAVVDDPVAQRSYREFAEHHGFLISTCRPRTPEHGCARRQPAARLGGPGSPGASGAPARHHRTELPGAGPAGYLKIGLSTNRRSSSQENANKWQPIP